MDQVMINKKHVSSSKKSDLTFAPAGSPSHVSTIHKKLVVDNPNYVSHWKIDGKAGSSQSLSLARKWAVDLGVKVRRLGTMARKWERRTRAVLCRF
jgi:hypothetical protein